MKFIIISIIVLVLALVIALGITILLNIVFKKKLNIYLNILISLSLFIVVLGLSFYAYFENPSKAKSEARDYLVSTEDVSVSKIDLGYYFDGSGTDDLIIFYPGARVEMEAYAPMMYKLAENGVDTIIVKMPFNFPMFGKDKANKIINEYEYKNYYISGHSLGGIMAGEYIVKTDKIAGIIFMASYSTKKINDNVKALSLYGSNDKVLSIDQYNKNKKNFPSNYEELVIEGGNHSQFGLYGKQQGDGKADISFSEQQDIIINKIVDFVL
ncbi:MAG: alpha/beta hydrolase [Acholeplasmatales bacterium]|nr:alpha/beta hydrolase [Acholeplasmatales bacterium]